MSCASCGRTNPAIARFCAGCGKPLAPRCPACGAEHEVEARFCIACGISLAVRPTPAAEKAEARKVVTIVFADLIGSTALHERLDPESVSRVMERYHGAVRVPVEAHGGTVVQLLGDGVMCAFGVPRVAEDDAIRAVRAAVGIQRAFREFARAESDAIGTVGLRVAVNTGEVVVSDDYTAGIGDPLNVAARLQQEARDGDVLIGESTERLVRALVTLAPFGVLSLKGRAETVTAYRVVSLDRPVGAATTAFVGRDDELRRIRAVYDSAVAAPAARLAVILGSPGLGKSRLLDEFARRLDGTTVLTAQCEAAGGTTFAPIARAVRAVLGIDDATGGEDLRTALDAALAGDDADRGRIAAGIGALLAGTPASPEETFFVVRRFLAGLAAAQPVVLAIDDLQWAEPLLLDLIEHLVQWSTGVPLLVLGAARPELRDARSALASTGRLVTDAVTLGGLDAGAATRLAANVIGADALPAAVAGRVLATSEGNPLFVGELVRMLVHDGALKREGDRWTTGVELARLEMPPTIQALLAARIERLRPEERTVLERAAVVGRQFSRAAVTHLLPREITDLDARLEALRRSELIEPDAGWFLGEPVLRFHHVLIRDAAYRRVLKHTRAELHGRFADWLEARVGEAVEHDETIGWHLEQAHQHLRELGPLDAQGRALGERAARYLAAAGRRALGRDDLPPAASLLGRALDRLDVADPARADLALDWCEALLAAGDVGPAARAIDELGRFTGDSGRLRAWHTCFTGQLAALTDPESLRATADAVAAAAEALAAAGDAAGEAKAHAVHASALGRLGKVGACEAALDRALAAARRGNDRRRSNAVLAGAPLAALWGPSPVTRASGRCLDVVRVLRITQGAPAVEAVALRCQGVLEALRGRTEAARRMIASSRRMVEELGIMHRLLEADVFAGLIELLEGDAAAAERCLRAAYDGLRTHGLGIDAAQAAALLGRALLLQDRPAEAEALSHESEALAGDDLQAAIAWRGVRAEALARRGEHASAVDFARAAVDLAAATDSLLYHADARLALAAALRAAGRSNEAAAEEARAIELWEAKGATLLAERARREAGGVEPAALPLGESTLAARATSRRVRGNAATVYAGRVDSAFADRNAEALLGLLSDDYEMLDHPSGIAYDREAESSSHRGLLRARDPTHRHEPLATLGGSLALCRLSVSAKGYARGDLDVGAYQRERVNLIEVDAERRARRTESFAAERLGDAIARLYERYAELLPDGPGRDRAAATARSVAATGDLSDLDRLATVLAPDVQAVDHRSVGYGAVQGADAALRTLRALLELSERITWRFDDVFDLCPHAILVRLTNAGTQRGGGGAFERTTCVLTVYGVDGRITRWEQFDVACVDKALARFEELTAEPAALRFADHASFADRGTLAAPARRRVRPNAASANAARVTAAVAARDADALPALLAAALEVVDHTTGVDYDRQGVLGTWLALLKAEDPTLAYEPLATLGDSLALCRASSSGSAFAGRKFDVGAYHKMEIDLVEVDENGQRRRSEIFAVDRLGDAVVRLYERYAELLPDGPERDRAAATARAVAALPLGGVEDLAAFDRAAAWFAPAFEYVDHRTVGMGTVHGAEALRRNLGALIELSEDSAVRTDDILALRPNGLLVRWTHFGTHRASGGAFDRRLCHLWIFGVDGRVTRGEQFDAERDAEALARFEEIVLSPEPRRRVEGLTSAPVAAHIAAAPTRAAKKVARRVRLNAATADVARIDAAMAARDAGALRTLLAELGEVVDHPGGVVYDREGLLATQRAIMSVESATTGSEVLATLGDSLALCRWSVSASGVARGKFDVGAYEQERIHLTEVDAQGRRRREEFFAPDRLGDVIARLYERYAELLPDGPARARAAATARSVAAAMAALDVEHFAKALGPDFGLIDHRTLGLSSFSGQKAEALLQGLRSWHDLGADLALSVDDVLGLQSGALLTRQTLLGTDRTGGGIFERPLLVVSVFDADGLVTRCELFDADRDDDALACFDELVLSSAEGLALSAAPHRRVEGLAAAAPAGHFADRASSADPGTPAAPARRRVRPNAATAHAARVEAAIAARDPDALPALFAEEVRVVDHTTGVDFDRQGVLGTWRVLLKAEDPTLAHESLATLGDSLALCRLSTSASRFVGRTFDVGAYEQVEVALIEVDAQGRERRRERFAADRLGDSVSRLYARYAELLPDGPAQVRAAATARAVAAMPGPFDADRWTTALAPDIEVVDHRILGTWNSGSGAEALRQGLRAWLEIGVDLAISVDDVLGLDPSALVTRRTFRGTDRAGGGGFERPLIQLLVFGTDGLVTRMEVFEADRGDQALARFDELVLSPEQRRRIEGLTAEPAAVQNATTPPRSAKRRDRRVRPNAAAAILACFDARDASAFASLLADEYEAVDHTTGITYDRQGELVSYRALASARDPTHRVEPLATLGDALALCCISISASGFAGRTFDVGAYEREMLVVTEGDTRGRLRRTEIFAVDRLGNAVARLYERYADLLPDGPARARAAATARAVAVVLGPHDTDRYATALAPAIEYVDHRMHGVGSLTGAQAVLRWFRSLTELAEDVGNRVDDVLALRPDAFVLRWTNFGIDRAGGGAYEQPFVVVSVFGPDGLVTRIELFDTDRDAEALARFDELLSSAEGLALSREQHRGVEGLTAEPAASRFAPGPSRAPLKREPRVQPNAATAHTARFDAAIVAREFDAFPTLFADESEFVDHPLGTTYDREGSLATWRSLLAVRDPTCRHEPLAVLGDSLALCRVSTSASGFAGGKFDVGPYQREFLILIEVDVQGRRRRAEAFASARLGDAVARLYERYAGLLPEGPAHTRAAATARSVAAVVGPFDVDRLATAFAPAVESVDHRILGTWSARGAGALLQHYRSVLELADDVAIRNDEVLSLRSDALLLRRTHVGTARAGGGAYERQYLALSGFGADGLQTLNEVFDSDREDEALARFDELALSPVEGLAAEPSAVRIATTPPRSATKRERRVRPNAATAHGARVDAVIAAQDADALPTLFVEGSELVEHPTGTTLDRQGLLATWGTLLKARGPTLRHEPLGTLGDSLALCRVSLSAKGFAGRTLDVGAYAKEEVALIEVDVQGRHRRTEAFAVDRLGNAVARLCERYAELLPDGPARARAAATARSVAVVLGPYDTDRYATAAAAAIEYVDHRRHGVGSLSGGQAVLRWFRSLPDLAEDVGNRVDDVLALRPDAFVLRWTNFGIDRAGGGAYEQPFVVVSVFGPDGLQTRIELFDTDREDEALARFDGLVLSAGEGVVPSPEQRRRVEGLTTTPAAPRIENAATRHLDRVRDAWVARDWGRFAALFPPGSRLIERRRLMRLEADRDSWFAGFRPLLEMTSAIHFEVLATRGDRIALSRINWMGADGDIGPSEIAWLTVLEVDDHGEPAATVVFDPEDLDAAYAELDRRYAAGEAAAHGQETVGMDAFVRAITTRDWDAMSALLSPDLVVTDHRPLGWETLHGPAAYVASLKSLVDLAPDVRLRNDHMSFSGRAALFVNTWVGTREGGAFEAPRAVVFEFDARGRIRSMDFYDPEQLAEARTRFEAVGAPRAPDPLRIPPNAATRARDRLWERVPAGDWEAVRALLAPGFVLDDRRRLNRLTVDRDMGLASIQFIAESGARPSHTVLATAGNRLALVRIRFATSDEQSAPATGSFDRARDGRWPGFEIEALQVIEVDAEGRILAFIVFDLNDRRGAGAEMLERYARSDEARWAPAGAFEASRAFNDHDLDRFRATLHDDFVFHDHRRTGVGTLERADAYIASIRPLFEGAPDYFTGNLYYIATEKHASLAIARDSGTLRDGGEFESVFGRVVLYRDGRIAAVEQFELEHLDAARARFEELRPDPARIPPNAAWRARERWHGLTRAGDWGGCRALASADFTYEDRCKHALVTGDVEVCIKSAQEVRSWPRLQASNALLGTAGDRIMVERAVWTGGPDAGPFEIELIRLVEVAADGRLVAWINFDLEDRSAAFAEARERHAAGEAAAIGGNAPVVALLRAFVRHDWETIRGCLAQDAVVCDRRGLGACQ